MRRVRRLRREPSITVSPGADDSAAEQARVHRDLDVNLLLEAAFERCGIGIDLGVGERHRGRDLHVHHLLRFRFEGLELRGDLGQQIQAFVVCQHVDEAAPAIIQRIAHHVDQALRLYNVCQRRGADQGLRGIRLHHGLGNGQHSGPLIEPIDVLWRG